MKTNTFGDGFKVGALAQGLLLVVGLAIGAGLAVLSRGR
jgi:hypothetical protein